MKAVWFVILFLILQQIEGNLIYPRVVGSSVGLPGIWGAGGGYHRRRNFWNYWNVSDGSVGIGNLCAGTWRYAPEIERPESPS